MVNRQRQFLPGQHPVSSVSMAGAVLMHKSNDNEVPPGNLIGLCVTPACMAFKPESLSFGKTLGLLISLNKLLFFSYMRLDPVCN